MTETLRTTNPPGRFVVEGERYNWHLLWFADGDEPGEYTSIGGFEAEREALAYVRGYNHAPDPAPEPCGPAGRIEGIIDADVPF